MEEKKEENNIRGPIGMTIIVTVIIVVVGAVMFTSVMNPLCNDAVDKAEDKLADLGNRSIDYQQGYNDALNYVRYYMNEPTNATSISAKATNTKTYKTTTVKTFDYQKDNPVMFNRFKEWFNIDLYRFTKILRYIEYINTVEEVNI